MKFYASFIPAFLAVISTAIACPPHTSTKTPRTAAHPVAVVRRNSSIDITRGASAFEVAQVLGTPAQKLGDNVWIYRNYDAGFTQSQECDCNILVVSFARDRVIDLQLVNRLAVAVLAKQVDVTKNAVLIASTQK